MKTLAANYTAIDIQSQLARISEKLFRVQLLIVPETNQTMPENLRCVLVAVDGSEESMNALNWTLDNVKLRPEGSLVIIHAQSPPSIAAGLNPGAIPFGGPSDVEVPAFTAAIEAHQRRITEAIITHAMKICADKNAEVKTQILIGDPKEKICEAVEELHADLLVMGCRSFGPIKRMFLGSVSNYCSNHVSCPVMIVKGTT